MQTIRVNKDVWERRNLPKFGQVAGMGPGIEPNVTSLSESYELRCEPSRREEEELLEKTELEKRLESRVVVCSLCHESGHFSLRCPKRKEIRTSEMIAAENENSGRADEHAEVTVHITNVPADIHDQTFRSVLNNLAAKNKASPPSRVFVVRDRATGICKGAAYVSFYSRESATRMVELIDGFGLDSHILLAEIAPPREDRGPRKEFGGEGGNRDFEGRGADRDVSVARNAPWRR